MRLWGLRAVFLLTCSRFQGIRTHLFVPDITSPAKVERIKGKRTAEVREMLGEAAYDEVVHRDNLVVS